MKREVAGPLDEPNMRGVTPQPLLDGLECLSEVLPLDKAIGLSLYLAEEGCCVFTSIY